jgi:VIT1/CCC1 family predicted Fe2+/Mn2+ transporter
MKFPGLLNPVDRIAEILFGLIMAVTIVGSLSVAEAGHVEVRTATAAAIGCNLAWGLVDAVFYVMRLFIGRMRNQTLARQIRSADPRAAAALIAGALPEPIAKIAGPREIEGMRANLVGMRDGSHAVLTPRDFLEALGVFVVVVGATFPVVIPFLVIDHVSTAMYASQAVAVAMLFMAGFGLARYGGHDNPLRAGAITAVLGVILIAAVKALGG